MGWIWFLFVVFSVLGNLLEKLMKEQNPSRPVKPGEERGRPLPPGKPFSFPPILMEEWAEEEEEERGPANTLPKTEPGRRPLPAEKSTPANPTVLAPEKERLVRDAEEDRFFGQLEEWGAKDFCVAFSPDADEVEEAADPDGRGIDARYLYDALLWAHVLPRPDWRTVPWRRRP